jgi:hypothetical protein
MKGYRQIVVGIAVLTLLIVIGVLYNLVSEENEDSTLLIEEDGSTNIQRHRHSFQSGLEEVSVWSLPQIAVPQATVSDRVESGAGRPTISAHEIVARIREMVSEDETFSSQQADEVNELIRQLMGLGEDALPVVREYLASGEDIRFRFPQRGKKYDYPTMRIALLETLIHIGGEVAVETMANIISKVRDERELLVVTYGLEKMAPGQYRETAISLAVALLERRSSGKTRAADIAPLFEVLQVYGDAQATVVLEQAVGRWNYYASLALANMPDGVGVPSLIRLSKDPAILALGTGDYALRPLAQVATLYPEARSALLAQSAANAIPESAWPSVASSLAGYSIRFGNPSFQDSLGRIRWTEGEILARIRLIDQLYASTSSQSAHSELQEARNELVKRQLQLKQQ